MELQVTRRDWSGVRSCRDSAFEPPERGFQRKEGEKKKKERERMKGLEPSTFCMASVGSVRARSRPFAESLYLQVILTPRPNTSERERTTSVTIVTTALRLESGR
jgi:hypothetical protein